MPLFDVIGVAIAAGALLDGVSAPTRGFGERREPAPSPLAADDALVRRGGCFRIRPVKVGVAVRAYWVVGGFTSAAAWIALARSIRPQP
jgi:hypothetical protein